MGITGGIIIGLLFAAAICFLIISCLLVYCNSIGNKEGMISDFGKNMTVLAKDERECLKNLTVEDRATQYGAHIKK